MRLLAIIVCAASLLTAAIARADEKADALLKEMEAATKAVQTLTADLAMSQQFEGRESKWEATVKLKKPNFARIEFAPIDRTARYYLPFQTIASDGKTVWELLVLSRFTHAETMAYRKRDADPQGRNIAGPLRSSLGTLIGPFFNPTMVRGFPSSKIPCVFVGIEKVGSSNCSVIEANFEQPKAFQDATSISRSLKYKLFIGPDKLLKGVAFEVITQENKTIKSNAWLKNVKIDVNLPDSDFAYEPPKTAKLYESAVEKLLLPIGQEAPDFNLPMLDGNKLSLSDARKGKKAVLVNFWSYPPSYGYPVFPHLQRIYSELKDKGLEIIAVNWYPHPAQDAQDTIEKITRYIENNKFTFKVVLGGADDQLGKLYGVQACPTNYLLDANGRIVWRGVGFDEQDLRLLLEKLGVK